MPVAQLFIPCLVNQFLPEVARACANVLLRLGVELVVPPGQTCCGQPVYKTGRFDEARAVARRHLALFEGGGDVVAPSGSCVHMMRHAYPELFVGEPGMRERALALGSRTYEFSEYLVDVLGVTDVGASFAGRAAYHDSCQVGRSLGVKAQPRALLDAVDGLTRVELKFSEECCGFGGPFAVQHAAVSEAILEDKLDDILSSQADLVVTAEPSCLLNVRGGLENLKANMPVKHIAEILDSGVRA